MFRKRYLQAKIESDLREKMVFLGGPRQVGKTALSMLIGKEKYKKFSYLNWDNPEDRKKIIASQFDPAASLLIFDEIHKYKRWKNYIKGQFDKHKEKFNILVTGSARLDLYRKGGDSMMGRYYYYRLHPFSLAEALQKKNRLKIFQEPPFRSEKNSRVLFNQLLKFGGFPEPFIKQDEKNLRRWHNQRIEKLIKEDIRDIENIRDLSAIQILVGILPEKVGSLLPINSLKEDLQTAFGSVKLWLDILERFYFQFRIYPFSASTIKSLRKEAKLYLWDWSQTQKESARLENLVASHLLKMCHFLYDAEGYKAELFYLRDIEKREVDFLVTIDKKPWMAVEVKNSDTEISKNMAYFGKKLAIPFQYQVVNLENIDFIQDDIRVISADKFLSGLI